LDGFLAEVPLEVRTVAPINFLGYWKFLELSNKARNPSAVAECPQWAAGAVSAARLR
jgi:hypothetical protein